MALVDVTNDLTDEQKLVLSNKLEAIMAKYTKMARGDDFAKDYFTGVADGLNHAFKLTNEIDDDYNSKD